MIEVRPNAASLKTLPIAALISGLALCPPALAQAQGVNVFSFDLFETDYVELKPDAAQKLADTMRKAQSPGQCPLGKLTIFTESGDPLFQQALAETRREAALQGLDRRGVPVAGRLFIDSIVFGRPGEKKDARYEMALDKKPPKLRTTSQPPKGTKVRPGQQITVTMTARDDPDPWPTGLKTIQLVADSEGGRFIASENYEPCSEPAERRVVATYTVPADPPPAVRLTALSEDHVGLMDTDVGEFPTGDFYGTLIRSGGVPPQQTRARADFVLNHDGKGNLTGTMVGQNEFVTASTAPGCVSSTKQPNRFRVSLFGAYTEARALKVFIENVEETGIIINNKCPTYSIDVPGNLAFKSHVWFYQQAFLGTPSPLGEGEVLPDGTRQYKWEGGANETLTVTLRRARN